MKGRMRHVPKNVAKTGHVKVSTSSKGAKAGKAISGKGSTPMPQSMPAMPPPPPMGNPNC